MCEAGKYASGILGSRFCLECDPGKISVSGFDCMSCSAGTYANLEKTECMLCVEGKWSSAIGADGISTCRNCPAGRYSSATGVVEQSKCNQCSVGRFSSVLGASASSTCEPCKEGRYQPLEGNSTCHACPLGYKSLSGSATCTGVTPGWFLNASNISEPCREGHMCQGKASGSVPCQKGKYAANQGGIQCFGCSPGKYADTEATVRCKICSSGRFQAEEGMHSCFPCRNGTFSAAGASECTQCDLGKYGRHMACLKCPTGQYSDARGSTTCLNCTDGKIPNSQATACEKPPWKTKEDCKLGEYLNDSSQNKTDHTCEICMYGGDCSKLVILSLLKPKKGYKSMSWNHHIFGDCRPPDACGGDCIAGHSGELCSECLAGWSTNSKQKTLCAPCPGIFYTILLFFGAVVLGVMIFSYLVSDNLHGARLMMPTLKGALTKMPFHSIAIRIVSSYLQIAGLLTRFDLTLPPAVNTLTTVASSSSSLSEQLLMFDCMTDQRRDRDLFLLRQISSVWLIPVVSIACCAFFWKVKGDGKIYAIDGFFSSLMVLFFTLFPSAINRIALTFSCKTYGPRKLLTEALSVECLDKYHWVVILCVGVPGVIIYVILIPGLIAKVLRTQRRKGALYPSQDRYNSRWTIRMGFVFAGYRLGYEWWEAVVMFRKCGFVLLSIFLRSYGPAPQVVAASMVLITSLSMHLQHRPYQDESHNYLESLGLHICLLQLLITLMSNMIGRVEVNVSNSPLGLQSTVVVILVVFFSTAYFFVKVITLTIHGSLKSQGMIGVIAKKAMRFSCIRRSAPLKIKPHVRLNRTTTFRVLEKVAAEEKVRSLQVSSEKDRKRHMTRLTKRKSHSKIRLQQRLAKRESKREVVKDIANWGDSKSQKKDSTGTPTRKSKRKKRKKRKQTTTNRALK